MLRVLVLSSPAAGLRDSARYRMTHGRTADTAQMQHSGPHWVHILACENMCMLVRGQLHAVVASCVVMLTQDHAELDMRATGVGYKRRF